MGPRLSRFLTYLLLLVPPLVVSFYLLASFPPPPPPLPLPTFPGLDSLSPDSRAREIYPIDWAGNGSGHWADLPLGRTRYWLVGPESGKKIVLIHGLSVPALVWAPLVPQLTAAGYRVLLYDLYGRGYSAAPAAAAYDANLYVTQLALLMQHAGWARARVAGLSMGGAVAAAFVNAFPALVERDVVLVACAGLVEASELSRTAKVMSSPIVQTLTTNPLVYAYMRRLAARHLSSDPQHRHNANDPPSPVESNGGVDAPLADLVRLQSAHLHGFNRAVSRSLRAGPITGLAWAFDTRGSVGGEGGEGEEGGKGVWSGRRVLVVHLSLPVVGDYAMPGTEDRTVPPAHATRIRALLTGLGPNWRGSGRRSASQSSEGSGQGNGTAAAHVELALIPGAGHGLTWTHADEVGGAVVAFFGGWVDCAVFPSSSSSWLRNITAGKVASRDVGAVGCIVYR